MKLVVPLRRRVDRLVREVARFGVVGSVGYAVDVVVFNLLRFDGDGTGPLYDRPVTAKVLAVLAATVVTYLGNRHWTWRHRGRGNARHEYALFVGLNAVGMFVAVGCLWFSHYVLGLTGPVADNISANVVGIWLGTAFRFWAYRRFVFPDRLRHLVAAAAPITPTAPDVDRPVTTAAVPRARAAPSRR